MDIENPSRQGGLGLEAQAGKKKFEPEGVTPVDLRSKVRGLLQPLRRSCLVLRVNVGKEVAQSAMKIDPQESSEPLLKALHGLKRQVEVLQSPR